MANRYALIVKNKVIKIILSDTDLTAKRLPPMLQCIFAPDEIGVGWTWDGVNWTAPTNTLQE